jgi:hypothetical protein
MFRINPDYIVISLKTFAKIYGLYLIWILLHYISGYLYIYYCLPRSIIGILMSPFLSVRIECEILRWLIYNIGNSMETRTRILGL